MSEAAPAKRPSQGDSSIQDPLDRVAKRLKVKKQTLLEELQAEFRLPASSTSPNVLPPEYGSQIYDWLDTHDDDERDSEDYYDAVEAQNDVPSVNHLPTPPNAQTGQTRRDEEPPSKAIEPALQVSQEEERKALLGIFRASSSGATTTKPGKGKGRSSFGSFYFDSNADVDFSPPAASENTLNTSDTESVNSFLEQGEGSTELAFEPKTATHSRKIVSNQQKARPRVLGLKRKAPENHRRLKKTGLSATFVTASKRGSLADDKNGTTVTTTQKFVTKSKRQNLIEDDEGIREVEGIESEAVKLFEGVFGYSPTSDPWKAHSLAKGPGNIDRKGNRDQTMIQRVAAIMVGAPTKWVCFTVLPSARRPAAPVRFHNAPTSPLVKPTVQNQTQAYQIYPLNSSIQVISEGLATRLDVDFKQKESEVWEKRKQALALDLKVPEESLNIQRPSLSPPPPPLQNHVCPRYPHQAPYPYHKEHGPPSAVFQSGQPMHYMPPQSSGSVATEPQSFQYKRDPVTQQLIKVPYTPASVLGANSKSLAELERAEAYYQKHRERLREAKAKQGKQGLDGGC